MKRYSSCIVWVGICITVLVVVCKAIRDIGDKDALNAVYQSLQTDFGLGKAQLKLCGFHCVLREPDYVFEIIDKPLDKAWLIRHEHLSTGFDVFSAHKACDGMFARACGTDFKSPGYEKFLVYRVARKGMNYTVYIVGNAEKEYLLFKGGT